MALLAIKYTNDDYYNPANFDDGASANNHGRKRQVTVFVEDAANQGKLADRKRNLLLAAAAPTNEAAADRRKRGRRADESGIGLLSNRTRSCPKPSPWSNPPPAASAGRLSSAATVGGAVCVVAGVGCCPQAAIARIMAIALRRMANS